MAVSRAIRRFLPFLLLCLVLAWPAPGNAQMAVGLTVAVAPPPLPVYAEPPLPADGYIFIPGYWAWAPSGYYWVPGTWVLPPQPGLLWTPGYWALAADGVSYVWQPGYWGPSVGFYGGIDYGFGYYGSGYDGGYWEGGFFFYNSEVHNFGRSHVGHVYGREVPAGRGPRVSFTGAAHGGVDARPGPDENRAAGEQHQPPHTLQVQHETRAATVRTAPATVNQGRPPVAATQQPATFTGRGITSARPPAPAPRPAAAPAPHPAAAAPAPHPAAAAPPPHPAAAPPAPHPAAAPPASHGGGGAPPQGGEPERH